MNSDNLLLGIVVAIFIYLYGYHFYGVLLAAGILIFFFLTTSRRKIIQKSPNVLEPIVIESTRGAPYRIPEYTELWVHPFAHPRGWFPKVTRKGLLGQLAKRIGWRKRYGKWDYGPPPRWKSP